MLTGGVADKLGNGYEAHWTLIEALRVLRGQADEIRLEPFNEGSEGLEFRLSRSDQNFWHQCKRRRASGSWTIGALNREGVLRAFAEKLIDPANQCVFVSEDPAGAFKSLLEKARLAGSVKDFQDGLSEADRETRKQLSEVWRVNPEVELNWLKRCHVESVSDTSILREFRGVASLMFEADPDAVLDRLSRYLTSKLTQTITTESFRAAIDELGIGWKARLDPTLDGRFVEATDEYLASLPKRIAGRDLEVADVDKAVTLATSGDQQLTVVAGGAGGGKSVALAKIVEKARIHGWSVLAFRIDWFLTSREVGEIGMALIGRAESPVGLLGNKSGNKPSLLVIDQIDAVSEASGRSGRVRELLFHMLGEKHFYPNMKAVIACRSYDLERDSRLKPLSENVRTASITLRPLGWDEAVAPVLAQLGLAERQFTAREKDILRVPINLQLFESIFLAGAEVEGEISSGRLFDQLLEVRARDFHAAGYAWTPEAALGAMAEYMSNNQELTAPGGVLAAFPGAIDALSSHGLISAIGGKLQFAHESYFDHTFSRHFLTTGQSVHDLLASDEQRLFRRTQVRQIFARLRDLGVNRTYLSNLKEVMDGSDIRYIVKDAVAYWLTEVDNPTVEELGIIGPWLSPQHAQKNLASLILHGRNWLPLLIKSGVIQRDLDESGNKTFAFSVLRKGAPHHPGIAAAFLRRWWSGEPERGAELVGWFNQLYAGGPIGDLEELYGDLVASVSDAQVAKALYSNFELGSWTHKSERLGARVLGFWLRRWMRAFSESHPFGDSSGSESHWLKKMAEDVPEAFLDAVVEPFAEALKRDRAVNDKKGRRTIRIPLSKHDQPYVHLIRQALTKVAVRDPITASTYCDKIEPIGEVALHFHLATVAANGEHLKHRLLPLMRDRQSFTIGSIRGGEWKPVASATKAALPHLSAQDRAEAEEIILTHRPELEWAKQFLRLSKERGTRDNQYVIDVLNRAGEAERAILTTIGKTHLSQNAARRIDELDRKFPNRPLPESYEMGVYWVESPIAVNKAALMTDRQWLAAMQRYRTDSHHSYKHDGVTGGAHELGAVLQARAKIEPQRFVSLAEQMPLSVRADYAEAVLTGVRESEADGLLTTRAIKAALRWQDHNWNRVVCWTVYKHPSAGCDPEVLARLLHIAEFGTASDNVSRTTSQPQSPRTSVHEFLEGNGDLEDSGVNEERGSAFEALASVLWDHPETFDEITALVERRADVEPLLSVLMCMLHTVNSIAKYDAELGVRLLNRLAARDLRSIHSRAGHHMLRWMSATYPEKVEGIASRLAALTDDSLRAFGLVLQAGAALNDDSAASAFLADAANDTLRRQVAAFRGHANLTSDKVGDRAARWLASLFNDPDKVVRDELIYIHWDQVLDGTTDRTEVARAYLNSAAFEDHSDGFVKALEERVDLFPGLAFETLQRILDLYSNWEGQQRQGHQLTFHHLGRLLVELYRAIEGNTEKERKLLDLFDTYLAHNQYDVRAEISRYERH
jgi:hypothetical protein